MQECQHQFDDEAAGTVRECRHCHRVEWWYPDHRRGEGYWGPAPSHAQPTNK